MALNIEGHSNPTGFRIWDKTNDVRVQTENYAETEKACEILTPPHLEKECYEWHSCEHRLINAIESRQELTLEKLKGTLDYHSRCSWGKWQVHHLSWPSQEKLEETLRVGQEYFKKLMEINKKPEA